jgi:hypothetical protein
MRNFLKQKNPQKIALSGKTRMKIFGLPADFLETKKFPGNCCNWQNPQEKPWEYLRFFSARKFAGNKQISSSVLCLLSRTMCKFSL